MTYCTTLVYIIADTSMFTLETDYHFLVSIAGLLRLMAGAIIYLVEAGYTTAGAACIEA
jgi:hypothetical protein